MAKSKLVRGFNDKGMTDDEVRLARKLDWNVDAARLRSLVGTAKAEGVEGDALVGYVNAKMAARWAECPACGRHGSKHAVPCAEVA